MSWEVFYLVCFVLGLALSLLSFVGGFGHLHFGHLHLGPSHLGHAQVGHAHLGHARVGHAHAAGGQARGPVLFNMFNLMAFLCWFGGAGYLLTRYRVAIVPIIFLLAVVAGLAGAAIIVGFFVKVLLPHERTLEPQDTEMRGVVARVISSLRAGGTGEILFSLDGTRRCAAARSEDGAPIARDAQVLVMRYEEGIAWVRPFHDLDDLESPESTDSAPT
jgi:hypothetical protein